jgi:transcriptional regulator with XRE-family HTH domain
MTTALRKLRKLSGVTQYQLARLSGVERTRLSLAENGHIQLGTSEYKAIHAAILSAFKRKITQFGEVLPNDSGR